MSDPTTPPDSSGKVLSFGEHLVTRRVEALRRAGVPEQRLSKAIGKLPERLEDVEIVWDGDRILLRDGDVVIDVETGQHLLDAPQTAIDPGAAEEHFDRACALEEVDGEAAVEAYRRALELDPKLVEARLNLGLLLHDQGHLVEAQREVSAALELDPRNPTAVFNLAVLLEDLGERDAALERYRELTELEPENADAWFNAHRLYEERGDRSSALHCLMRCREITRKPRSS